MQPGVQSHSPLTASGDVNWTLGALTWAMTASSIMASGADSKVLPLYTNVLQQTSLPVSPEQEGHVAGAGFFSPRISMTSFPFTLTLFERAIWSSGRIVSLISRLTFTLPSAGFIFLTTCSTDRDVAAHQSQVLPSFSYLNHSTVTVLMMIPILRFARGDETPASGPVLLGYH